MKTGYFARATEEGHRAKSTQVHIIYEDGYTLCGYKAHKTMQFCVCAFGVHLPYVECKKCLQKYLKYQSDFCIKEAQKRGIKL